MVVFFIVLVTAASLGLVMAYRADQHQWTFDDDCEEETQMGFTIGLPKEPCTPGATWCETRNCGARMSTCSAAGEWGAWVGCGRGSTCASEGYGGSC